MTDPKSNDSGANQSLLLTPSPYDGSIVSSKQHIQISCLWLAINAHWGALLVILLPTEIAHIAPDFRAEALGLFSGIGAIIALLAPLVIGPLSDRCRHRMGRRKPYIAYGIGLNLLGLIAMAVCAHNSAPIHLTVKGSAFQNTILLLHYGPYVSFLLAFLVVQLGSNITSAAFMGFVPDLIPSNQRGLASGYVAVMSQLGTLVGAVGTGLLLNHFSVYVKYGFIGVLLAVTGFVAVYSVEEYPLVASIPKLNWPVYFCSLYSDLVKSKDFLWVWITRFLVMLGFYAIQPFINYYLVDIVGLKHPNGPASELIGIILIASSISGYYGGKISDRLGRKKVVYYSSISMAGFVLLFTLCRSFVEVLVVGLFFGIGFGSYVSVDWALGADALPNKDEAGKDMAVWHVAMTLPQSISPPIAGAIIGAFIIDTNLHQSTVHSVHYGIFGYALVFLFCACAFLAGGYFLKNVRNIR